MINLGGIQPPVPPRNIGSIPPTGPVEPQPQVAQPADVVEISQVAHLAAKAQELPEIRAELVAQVKAEIAAGTYETSERLEITVERLMDDLIGGL